MLTPKKIKESQKILVNARDGGIKVTNKTLEDWNKKIDSWTLKVDNKIKELIINIDLLMWDTSLQGQSYQHAKSYILFKETVFDKLETIKTIGYDDIKLMHAIFAIQTFGSMGSEFEPEYKCKLIVDTYETLITTSEEIDYFDYMIQQLTKLKNDFEQEMSNELVQSLDKSEKK